MTRAEARALRAAQASGGDPRAAETSAQPTASGSTDERPPVSGLPAWPAEPPPVRDVPEARIPFASVPTSVPASDAAEPATTAVPTAAAQPQPSAPAGSGSGVSPSLGSDGNDEAFASTILSPLGVDGSGVDASGASGGESPSGGTSKRKPKPKPRQRVTVTGVIGELLITFGVVVLLYVAWQLWIGDWIYSSQHNAEGAAQSQQWQADFEAGDIEIPEPVKDPETETWVPPVIPEPGDTVEFAQMRIPRFGEDYSVRMAGGVTRAGTLDPIGIGHYPGTAMPGEVGNFALAAHRTTWGKPFNLIADLQLDDPIVIETPHGWYTYRFRTLEYVTPDQVDVLLDVPQAPDVPPGGKYITLTSCSPMYSLAERIVAYGVFDSFQPRSEGAPAWLTEGAS